MWTSCGLVKSTHKINYRVLNFKKATIPAGIGVVLHIGDMGMGKQERFKEKKKRESRRKRVKGGQGKEGIILFRMVLL